MSTEADKARAALDAIEQAQGIKAISGYYHSLNESAFVHVITKLFAQVRAEAIQAERERCARVAEDEYCENGCDTAIARLIRALPQEPQPWAK